MVIVLLGQNSLLAKWWARVGEYDVLQHAVVERGELRALAAAPAPFAQRGERRGRLARRVERSSTGGQLAGLSR